MQDGGSRLSSLLLRPAGEAGWKACYHRCERQAHDLPAFGCIWRRWVRIDFVTTFGIVEGFPSFPEATLARDLTALGHHVRALTYYAKSSGMIDTRHECIDGTE